MLTKLDKEVRSLCLVHLMAVLLNELCVEVVEVAEGQLRGVGLLTKSQVADAFFNDIATMR